MRHIGVTVVGTGSCMGNAVSDWCRILGGWPPSIRLMTRAGVQITSMSHNLCTPLLAREMSEAIACKARVVHRSDHLRVTDAC